jgi:UDP-N-acetylglucosamine 4,6-dehydratase
MGQKRALISGGSGFLGTRLALALKATHQVFLADKNEEQNRVAERITECPALPMDIADIKSVRGAFLEARPDLIIHAAALKFVDLAEKNPLLCADVNVIGSQNLARVAMERDCGLVVGISSNRAAPPTDDTYGLTKAILERMCCSLNSKTQTKFACVRLGNIAWSTGSVLPTWKRMLDESSVIKTTGPNSRRFFFGVDDAVKLVMTCIDHIDEFQGKVLARRLKQARVKDLLEKFIELRGGRWEQVDPRPGERLEETLIGELELPYCQEKQLNGAIHYSLCFNEKAAKPLAEAVSTANVEPLTTEEIVRLIKQQPELPAAKRETT